MSTGRPHHYVYSRRSGADNPRGQTFDGNPLEEILMSTGTSFHFSHLFKLKKKISLKSDFIYIYIYIYIYITDGHPRGQSFDVNRNVFSLHSFIHLSRIIPIDAKQSPFQFPCVAHNKLCILIVPESYYNGACSTDLWFSQPVSSFNIHVKVNFQVDTKEAPGL